MEIIIYLYIIRLQTPQLSSTYNSFEL